MSTHSATLRVMHTAALLRPPSGIVTQMEAEQAAADELSLSWKAALYCPKNRLRASTIAVYDPDLEFSETDPPIRKIMAWLKLRRNYHAWLKSCEEHVDIYVLRYYVHDPFQFWFARNSNKPVVFIHHTLEVSELAMSISLKSLVRATLESILGFLTLRYASAIVGVTKEILDYQIKRSNSKLKPVFTYPNGISYNNKEFADERHPLTPELLFVANFAPWHGLDILLSQCSKNTDEFTLHLVGEIPKNLIYSAKDSRIQVHGHKTKDQVKQLSKKCWIGLASFALYRKKMSFACPLKVREYLSLGLPVYGDYKEVFPDQFPYYKQGVPHLQQILDFAKTSRVLSKEQVSKESEAYISKKYLLGRFNSFLISVCNSEN
jgi:glycosyltransferase involved in cell wall biosynthesis